MATLRFFTCIIFIFLFISAVHAQTSIAYNTNQAPVDYAMGKLRQVLVRQGLPVVMCHADQSSVLPDIWMVAQETLPDLLKPYMAAHWS